MIPATVTFKGIWAALIAFAFAILFALLVVQTVRLEGFKIWPVSIEGCIARSERLRADLDKVKASQKEASRKQAEVIAKKQAEYDQLAKKAQTNEQKIHDLSRALTDSYASNAAHRLRPEALGGSPGGSRVASEDNNSGVSETVPEDALVAISIADLHTCSDNSVYALTAYEWARELAYANEGG